MNSIVAKETQKSGDGLRVPKHQFDAILGKLLSTPPKPVTPKRKARKAKRKTSQ